MVKEKAGGNTHRTESDPMTKLKGITFITRSGERKGAKSNPSQKRSDEKGVKIGQFFHLLKKTTQRRILESPQRQDKNREMPNFSETGRFDLGGPLKEGNRSGEGGVRGSTCREFVSGLSRFGENILAVLCAHQY